LEAGLIQTPATMTQSHLHSYRQELVKYPVDLWRGSWFNCLYLFGWSQGFYVS